MADAIKLTQREIEARATDRVYARGETLYETGAITSPTRRGHELRARCRGSAAEPYRVWAEIKNGRIAAAGCDCLYQYDGHCKHIIAMLLACLHAPQRFATRETLREELSRRDKSDLLDIIEDMILRHPDLEEIVDRAKVVGSSSPIVDLKAIRQELKSALAPRGEWMDSTAEDKVYELAALGERCARRGDSRQAIEIYCVILEACNAADYPTDDEGQYISAVNHAADSLREALSEFDLAQHEGLRLRLVNMLAGAVIWDIDFGGIAYAEDAGAILLEIIEPADTPAIRESVRVAEEKKRARGYYEGWTGDAFEYFLMRLDKIDATPPEETLARLKAKERHELYASVLLQLGRNEEAVATVASFEQAYELIRGLKLLVKHEQHDSAIQLAEAALDREHDGRLAAWLIDFYKERGDEQAEIRWLLNRMRRDPNIENYVELRAAAASNETWLATRAAVLSELEQDEDYPVLARVYLHDEEWDLAWDALESAYRLRDGYAAYTLFSLAFTVAEASRHARPRQAIPVYVHHARGRISHKSRKAYASAAELLQEVRWMYQQLNDIPGWEKLIADLRQEYARMPALQDEFNKAGL